MRDEFLGRMSGQAAPSLLLKLGRPQKVLFFFPLGCAPLVRLEYSDLVLRPIRACGFFPLYSAIIGRSNIVTTSCGSVFGRGGLGIEWAGSCVDDRWVCGEAFGKRTSSDRSVSTGEPTMTTK